MLKQKIYSQIKIKKNKKLIISRLNKEKKNNIKKILKIIDKYNHTKKINILLIKCYLDLKKQIKEKIENPIRDLKILLRFLEQREDIKKKECNLNKVYKSYKEVLIDLLKLKRKINYYSYLSQPLISEDTLRKMIKQQSNIMEHVHKVSKAIPQL